MSPLAVQVKILEQKGIKSNIPHHSCLVPLLPLDSGVCEGQEKQP
jgi:hypothetical protein